MSRIDIVKNEEASHEQLELLETIEKDMGLVPNFLRVLANSPVALNAYLGLHRVSSDGDLDPRTRVRIALAIAQQNSCQYCVSVHTAIGRESGLDEAEMKVNRRGTSQNQRAAAAVQWACSLSAKTGDISNKELMEIRKAGYSEAEIVEIITLVGLNTLSNLISRAADVEIDSPKINLDLTK